MRNATTPVNLVLLIGLFLITACEKELETPQNNPSVVSDMNNLVIPTGFDFATDEQVLFTIKALDNQNEPLPGVRFDAYSGDPNQNGRFLFSGMTNSVGTYEVSRPIQSSLEKLFISTNFIGLPNLVEVDLGSSNLEVVFGGNEPGKTYGNSNKSFNIVSNGIFTYMGTYDFFGVPDYLEPQNVIIDAQLLGDINASFPESDPMPVTHPQYLDPDNEHDFKLDELAEVWVTFVHEGA